VTRRIVTVGDIMIDVVAQLDGPLAPGSDSPGRIAMFGGGSAANTAAWLGWLGLPAVFVGRTGDDVLGRAARRALSDGGVDVRASVDTALPTGICVVLVGPDGERTMIPSPGANAALTPDDVGNAALCAPRRLHLSGYTLMRDSSRPAALTALRAAAEAGTPVSVDAASSQPLRVAGAQRFLAWVPASGLLIANAEEAAVLTDEDDPVLAATVLARRFAQVVVKRGPLGAVAADATGTVEIPASAVTAVDSTGAGDAFAAGLLAALVDGASLPDAVELANETGSRAVRQPGARPAVQR
jgi:sugar/nucleoside kinase (ribokinase family)